MHSKLPEDGFFVAFDGAEGGLQFVDDLFGGLIGCV